MWMPCCLSSIAVTVPCPRWPPSCQSPGGSLIGRAQSGAGVTVAQTQHYHHTVTLALHGHKLLLIQIGMNLGAGDSLFFIALSLSFFGFLSSTNLCFLRCFTLSSLRGGRNRDVTAAASQKKRETSSRSLSSPEPQ